MRRAALTVVLLASLMNSVNPSAHAAQPYCSASGTQAILPIPSTVATDTGSTTIPGGSLIGAAPSENISPLGGGRLVPDGAAPGNYMFNWRYPPRGAGPASFPNPRGWAIQFQVGGATNIEFQVYARQDVYWTMVLDGHPTSDIPVTAPGVKDGHYLIRYSLPDSGEHQVRFYMNNLSLGGIFGDRGSHADARPAAGPRVFYLGDSLTQGGAQSTGGELASWIWAFSRMCGFDDAWNGGIGGTGSIASGNDGLWAGYPTRTATDIVPANPDLVFITSYYGDRSHSPSEIAAAFTRTIEAVQTSRTHPSVVVTGSYDPSGLNGSPYKEIDAALSMACASLGVPYIEPRTGTAYDGTGRPVTPQGETGPWITPQNRSTFVGADGVHQTDAGQVHMAQRMYDSYRSLAQGD